MGEMINLVFQTKGETLRQEVLRIGLVVDVGLLYYKEDSIPDPLPPVLLRDESEVISFVSLSLAISSCVFTLFCSVFFNQVFLIRHESGEEKTSFFVPFDSTRQTKAWKLEIRDKSKARIPEEVPATAVGGAGVCDRCSSTRTWSSGHSR